MNCPECHTELPAGEIHNQVQYFVCSECGHCHEVNLSQAQLEFSIIHRPAVDSAQEQTPESYSSDFVVNGNSLLKVLTKNGDHIGCFARGWQSLNTESHRLLIPTNGLSKAYLYVCPLCADPGCGAYTCEVKAELNVYIWQNFAYENGLETAEYFPNLGPFRFKAEEYENVVNQAYAL